MVLVVAIFKGKESKEGKELTLKPTQKLKPALTINHTLYSIN